MLALFWTDQFDCVENANGDYVGIEAFLNPDDESAHEFVGGINEDDTGVPFPDVDAYFWSYTAEVAPDRVLIDISIEVPHG